MNESQSDRIASVSTARKASAFLPLKLDRYPRGELRTSCNPDEEIFAALSFYCDVEEAGKRLVSSLTGFEGKQCDDTYDLFQAFIRQGYTFFSSARQLHHRASPLFYYYAFLNLAKAFISLRKPDVFAQPLKHGLTQKYESGDAFDSQRVAVVEPGVFPELYELLTDQKLPRGCSFRIVDLLSYLTDISFEYQDAGFGTPVILPVRSRLLFSQKSEPSSDMWPCLALGNAGKLLKREYSLSKFLESFDEISLGKNECERIFGIMAHDQPTYRFFQSKKIYRVENERSELPALHEVARAAIKLLFMPNVFSDEEDFHFALPLAEKPSLKMDEFIAGYLIFFYLGSLVRYHPYYLERILRSKEAWIIQRFATSYATTILRHASIYLLGQNRVLSAR